MAYHFANQQDVKELNEWCRNILLEVQKEVSEYFTFDFRLIGSGEKRLVTQNSDEAFDLDYNIILQKDKKGLVDNPKQIKDIFVSRFNKVLERYVDGYSHSCDSTSVITRNAVMHNKFLLLYRGFAVCYVKGVDNNKSANLKANILNLISFLPKEVGKKCRDEINACKDERDNIDKTRWDLPEQIIISI